MSTTKGGYHKPKTAGLEKRAAMAERALFRIRTKRMVIIEKRNKLSDQSQILKRQEEAAEVKLATLRLSITGLNTALAYKAQRIKELTGVDSDANGIHGLAPAPVTGLVRREGVSATERADSNAGDRVFAKIVEAQVDRAADHSDAALGRHVQDQGGVQRSR